MSYFRLMLIPIFATALCSNSPAAKSKYHGYVSLKRNLMRGTSSEVYVMTCPVENPDKKCRITSERGKTVLAEASVDVATADLWVKTFLSAVPDPVPQAIKDPAISFTVRFDEQTAQGSLERENVKREEKLRDAWLKLELNFLVALESARDVKSVKPKGAAKMLKPKKKAR